MRTQQQNRWTMESNTSLRLCSRMLYLLEKIKFQSGAAGTLVSRYAHCEARTVLRTRSGRSNDFTSAGGMPAAAR